ncbi:hypothetical protein [Aestuariivirga sp.]|uniref:hypothetical protein n=1 Tax=Aestuariivirga sp. TaxID=2650926 RepID=UPI00391ADFD7
MPPFQCPCLPAHFSQIIIAGGDEDIGPADLIDWIHPVLSGIPGGLWLTCEIGAGEQGLLTARLQSGTRAQHLALCQTVPRRHASRVRSLLPAPPPTALILLNDHAAQVMSLLDGMAQWLNLFEGDDPALAPILRLLDSLGEADAADLPAAALA